MKQLEKNHPVNKMANKNQEFKIRGWRWVSKWNQWNVCPWDGVGREVVQSVSWRTQLEKGEAPQCLASRDCNPSGLEPASRQEACQGPEESMVHHAPQEQSPLSLGCVICHSEGGYYNLTLWHLWLNYQLKCTFRKGNHKVMHFTASFWTSCYKITRPSFTGLWISFEWEEGRGRYF